MTKKMKGKITDTATQIRFRSPYEGKGKLSTKTVKKIQSGVRSLRKWMK